MNRCRLAKVVPRALLLCLFPLGAFAQLPPAANPPGVTGQGGVIQEPLRLCVLHDFSVVKGDPSQFMIPGELTSITQGLAALGDKDFYGASSTGGKYGKGTVYKVPYQSDTIKKDEASTVLYDFTGLADGASPEGGVVLGPDGYLYGTTTGGGAHAGGTIFKIARTGGPPQTLYSFGSVRPTADLSADPQPTPKDLLNVNGGGLQSPVVFKDNYLYGVTASANALAMGTIFRIAEAGGSLEYLYVFKPQGAKDFGTQPYTIALGKDGMFYGTTLTGGLGFGTVFQFNPGLSGAGAVKTIFKFNGSPTADVNSGAQANQIVQGDDGTLYGTTRLGGPNGRGTVFSLTLSNDSTIPAAYKDLHPFGGREANPAAGVVIVRQKVPTKRPPPPTSCPAPAPVPPPAGRPKCTDLSLLTGPSPELNKSDEADYVFGIATATGVAFGGDLGTIFRLRTDGSDFATVYNFDSQSGAAPNVTPVLGSDDNLYGITAGGGPNYGNAGVFYRLSTAYLVDGQKEHETLYSTACQHARIEFQGSADTRVYNNPVMQVTTDIAGYQAGQAACSQAKTLHGIIVRMKDPTVKVVQLFYRERYKMVTNIAGGKLLQPVYGITDGNYTAWLGYYDPTTTYAKSDEIAYLQKNGTYLAFTSQAGDNKGNTPPNNRMGTPPTPDTNFWRLSMTNDMPDCNGSVHQCIPLTTNETFPKWVPDAEPPNYLYRKDDVQVDCDGIEIFDSPGFNEGEADIEQRFTGITLEIIPAGTNGQTKDSVLAYTEWRIVKHGNDPLQYWVPALPGGPPSTALLNSLRDALVSYGFTPDF